MISLGGGGNNQFISLSGFGNTGVLGNSTNSFGQQPMGGFGIKSQQPQAFNDGEL